MIPKKIHYVWVGHNPKSPIIEECIATWKKNCLIIKLLSGMKIIWICMRTVILNKLMLQKNGPSCQTMFEHGLFMNKVGYI